jgi:Leucine-rich repeat (LRR) protein
MQKELIVYNSNIELQDFSKHLEKIIFENNYRGIIPLDKLSQLDNLKYLKSCTGNIRDFNGLGLESIDTLILNENRIDIFINFQNLKNLIYLDFSKNRIKTLRNTGINNIRTLKHLDLSCNFLKEVDELEHLNSIEHLQLNSNRIKKINFSFAHFHNLKYINLSDNLLKEIPKGLCEIENLEIIEISGNSIPKEEINDFKSKRTSIVIK